MDGAARTEESWLVVSGMLSSEVAVVTMPVCFKQLEIVSGVTDFQAWDRK